MSGDLQTLEIEPSAQNLTKALNLGLEHHQAGRLPQAEVCYRQILAIDPEHADALHLLGVLAQQVGRLDIAVQLISAAIQRNPDASCFHTNLGNTYQLQGHLREAAASYRRAVLLDQDFETLHSLARALAGQGSMREAIAVYRKVIKINPECADAYYNLGNAYAHCQEPVLAARSYRRAATLRPDCATFHYNLARVLQGEESWPEAIAAYNRVLQLTPQDFEAHQNLGVCYWRQEDLGAAAKHFRQAIQWKPDYAEAHNNLGVVIRDEDLQAAAKEFEIAVSLNPGLASAHNNCGGVLWKRQDLAGALLCCKRALELDPELADAYSTLAVVLADMGEMEAAQNAYHRYLEIRPGCPIATHNLGMTHLIQGNFSEGWRLYESRWQAKEGKAKLQRFTKPMWQGEDLTGSTILLHAEQGLGDTLQFARYTPLVAQQGAKVVLEVQHGLRGLLSGMQGAAEVIAKGDPLPDFDWHCPLMRLPFVFGTDITNMPADIPYISADPARVRVWSERLAGHELRVGLVWGGNPKNKADHKRSISLERLAPLTEIEGAVFYSLQKGPPAAQIESMPSKHPIDLSAMDTDLSETAAIVSNLDLLISVDTSVAHLAGALGKPVWLLLPFVPDWRWMLGREDSPWYPTARLFRQAAPNAWDELVSRVTAELRLFSPPLAENPIDRL